MENKIQKKTFLTKLNRQKAGYLFVLPQFLLFMVFVVYPILNGIRLSFYKITFKGQSFIGLNNYVKLFNDENFITAISNTILFVIAIVALSVGIGVVISAVIFDKNSKLVSFVRTCYYIPVVVSMVVMSVTWSFLFSTSNGLINYIITSLGGERVNWLGNPKTVMPIIIFVTFVSNVGQVIVLYVASMVGISPTLFEAAEVDGINPVQRFTHIILPMVRPTTLYIMITQTIAVVKIYIVIQLLTNGGPNHASVTLMYYLYEKAFQTNNQTGQAAAIGVIMFIICLFFSLLQVLISRKRSK